MKRTIPAIMAICILTLSGCSKEEKEQVPTQIKSYTKELVQRDVVSVRNQIVPTFDSNGRLSSISTDSYMLSDEGTVKSFSKSTTTYVYDESAHTAVETDIMEGELASIVDEPMVTELTFDNSWKLTSTYFSMLESTYTFGYDGDRMTQYTSRGLSHEVPYDITWKNGDIVSIADESETITITYLPDGNPFKKGIDPTLDNLLPNYYTYRMTGINCTHLPHTYTVTSGNVKTYKYEYKKDADGRITEIIRTAEGDTSYHVIKISY